MFEQPAGVRASRRRTLWLAIVGTLGSWAILVPSKFAEGKLEDQVPMRLTLLLLGALVGVAAWLLGDALMLNTPGWREPVERRAGLVIARNAGLARDGRAARIPRVAIYVAYFAFLFLLPRWWRQTEFTRDARLSLWWRRDRVLALGLAAAYLLVVPATARHDGRRRDRLCDTVGQPWMPPSRRRALSEMNEATA